MLKLHCDCAIHRMRCIKAEYQIKELALAGWFKRIFSGDTGPSLPVERELQNERIHAALLKWQRQWHDYFDSDHDLVAAGEFDRPAQLPADINCDFRLINGLYHAKRDTREKCFALFPEGAEMQKRFEDFLLSKPMTISEADARTRLVKIVALIESIGPNENVYFSNVRIVNRDTDEGFAELVRSDNITILLEHSLLSNHPVDEVPQVAARLFLTEPLYVAAGNDYHVCDWITAAMTGGATDALHAELYQLWTGGWEVALGEDGLILAHRNL